MSDTQKTHELTVIVFTDIVGFTATMQQDEDRAMKMVGQVREIITSTLPEFKGSLLKEIGDGARTSMTSPFKSSPSVTRAGSTLHL